MATLWDAVIWIPGEKDQQRTKTSQKVLPRIAVHPRPKVISFIFYTQHHLIQTRISPVVAPWCLYRSEGGKRTNIRVNGRGRDSTTNPCAEARREYLIRIGKGAQIITFKGNIRNSGLNFRVLVLSEFFSERISGSLGFACGSFVWFPLRCWMKYRFGSASVVVHLSTYNYNYTK